MDRVLAAPRRSVAPVDDRTGRSGAVDPPTVDILGIHVHVLGRRAARVRVQTLAARPGHDVLAFVNAHGVNLASRRPDYRAALTDADLLLNDGIGLTLAARLDGVLFPANLNGTDLMPDLLTDFADRGHRVFFYGGAPGIADRAARHWARRVPGLQVAGALDGYTVSGAAAAELVREAGADVVLAALGNPGQELWATTFGPRSGARLTVGVGAFFDFSVGAVRRAPRSVRRLHLEWAFRLLQEPRRLARRYLIGVPVFLTRVGWGQLRGRVAVPDQVAAVAGVVVLGPWNAPDARSDPARHRGVG